MKNNRIPELLSLLCAAFFLQPNEARAACGVTTQSPQLGGWVYINISNSGACTFLDVGVGLNSTSEFNAPPYTTSGSDSDFKPWFIVQDISATLNYSPGSYTNMTHCLTTEFWWMYYDGDETYETLVYPEPELCYLPAQYIP